MWTRIGVLLLYSFISVVMWFVYPTLSMFQIIRLESSRCRLRAILAAGTPSPVFSTWVVRGLESAAAAMICWRREDWSVLPAPVSFTIWIGSKTQHHSPEQSIGLSLLHTPCAGTRCHSLCIFILCPLEDYLWPNGLFCTYGNHWFS